MFSTLTPKDGGYVTFGDNKKGKIIGIGSIGKSNSLNIENVLLVDGLKHNLLSISQLCDKGNKVVFDKSRCTIENKQDNKILFVENRHENIYVFHLNEFFNSNIK